MAIANEPLNVADFGWCINSTSADASGAEVIKAAPATGNHYIEYISINTVTAQTVTVGSGESSDAVVKPIVGPITFTADGSHQYSVRFPRAIKVDATTLIAVDASSTGAIQTIVSGYTKL